nr:retrovirus-related Pol polyprotein from transposon TNT 1-94 [Tanacetum cinerariifolium]
LRMYALPADQTIAIIRIHSLEEEMIFRRFYFPPSNTIPRHSRRKNTSIVESEIRTNATMADNRTMAQMLQAPIEGYEDAIVVPPINGNNFELKQTLINLVQSNQFTGRQDPHNHLRFFNKVASTFRHPEVPNTTVKLLLFPFSLEGESRIWLDKEPPRSILTWEDLEKGVIDSGCSRHMIGNMSYLIDYEEIDEGYVAFGEAVNTAYYVQNRVLVTKPHNKTPYGLLHGRTLALGFMRPFRCSVTILNTKDHLGKFDGKVDEGFFIGYSLNSKSFRVFNSRTRIVEEIFHIRFIENTPNIAESTKACDDAGKARVETILLKITYYYHCGLLIHHSLKVQRVLCNTSKSGSQRNVKYPRALLHGSIAQDMKTTTKRVI